MLSSNVGRLTTTKIYVGTLFISILSFFTTFKGLCIILSWELALLGSLGIQTAMLGIAWNLIKIKEDRKNYVIAFSVAAIFSIFFSYANFDTNLKANTRPREARSAYYEAVRPVLSEYASITKNAAIKARYQCNRLNSLINMEEEKGWSTIIDEGSQDKFLQSIIDGARLTVESWKQSTGTDYRQGKGRGIIINYLESRQSQSETNLKYIESYIYLLDSLTLSLTTHMTVTDQYNIVNKAYVNLPISVVSIINYDEGLHGISTPPSISVYTEKPANTQQALMLVINDLFHMDRLAFLSLMLAIAIDFIVILIAFAGSHIMAKSDFMLEKIKGDTAKRLKSIKLEDTEKFNKVLEGNLEIYKKAAQYGKDISTITDYYQNSRNSGNSGSRNKSVSIKYAGPGSKPFIAKEKSRLEKWLKSSKQHIE